MDVLELSVAVVGGLLKVSNLFRCHPIFALSVIRGFNRDFAQGDDVRSADNADVFAAGGRCHRLRFFLASVIVRLFI